MKSIITIVSTALALTMAIATSGFAIDVAVVFAIAAASALVGMFVGDYSRVPRYNLEVEKAPARATKRSRQPAAGVEFASLIIFNTTAA